MDLKGIASGDMPGGLEMQASILGHSPRCTPRHQPLRPLWLPRHGQSLCQDAAPATETNAGAQAGARASAAACLLGPLGPLTGPWAWEEHWRLPSPQWWEDQDLEEPSRVRVRVITRVRARDSCRDRVRVRDRGYNVEGSGPGGVVALGLGFGMGLCLRSGPRGAVACCL